MNTSTTTDDDCGSQPAPSLTEFSTNELCDIFRKDERRYVLFQLYNRSDEALHLTEDNLVEGAYHANHGEYPESEEAWREMYLTLVNNHLPKLQAANLVTFDAEEGMVRLRESLPPLVLRWFRLTFETDARTSGGLVE